jgi:S-methylmethionine-dependent homocysteine/selenocysteine methylase
MRNSWIRYKLPENFLTISLLSSDHNKGGSIMARYRNALPQLAGDLFLTDAGVETDLIFNLGIDIPEFAAHTLLPDKSGREALGNYFRGFLSLANEIGCGYILDSVTLMKLAVDISWTL